MMSGKRMVSSVTITLAPPRRADISRGRPDSPPMTPPDLRPPSQESWSDHEELLNGAPPPPAFLDEIPPEEDCLSPDLPPPPPPPPGHFKAPKRVALDPPPPPPPDALSLELEKLELAYPASQQVARPPMTVLVRPPTTDPVRPPVTAPVRPPTTAPATPPVTNPVRPPETSPVMPPVTAPVRPPTTDPVMPPVTAPVMPHSLPSTTQQKREEPVPGKQNGYSGRSEGSDTCAFCHKLLPPAGAAIEAMRRQYHAHCFTCRKCNRLLAGQLYYQKDGQPICEHCYKDTLEKCANCQTLIMQHIVRAMGNSYHPECFRCVACHRTIADESFAVDEYNDVYCAEDYYRKYAPVCAVCDQPIVPKNGQDSYKVECIGRSFHENCYRCEKCRVLLSLEPTESGCYPLNGHILCKSCHLSWKDELS